MTSNTRRLQPAQWAAVVCAIACAALFQFYGNSTRGYIDTASLFYWWGFQWNNPGSETQHGWLVLGLSGWLLARNLRTSGFGVQGSEFEVKGRSGEAAVTPNSKLQTRNSSGSSSAAVAALLGGLALHAVGFVGQQTRVSILAFLLCAWGVLRLGGGRRWGAAAAFPLGFMVFAIPINVLDSIGFWLRVWVVDASGAIARFWGIAVLQSGTQLIAPDGKYNYDVAAACSGIRSLTAMAALSLLAGYLNFRGSWRRAVVLLICFPLVYVGNVARIVAIVFAAEAGGPKWGDIAHEVMGFGVFAIVLGGVLAAVAAIRRWWPEGGAEEDQGPRTRDQGLGKQETAGRETAGRVASAVGSSAGFQPAEDGMAGWRPTLLAALVCALVVGEGLFLRKIANLPVRGEVGVRLAADGKDPVELPAFLGIEWTGRAQPVSAAELEILPPDTGYSRKLYFNHRDPAKQVFLSIVLSGRDRSSIHRPELCLVGQGWTVEEARQHRFAVPSVGEGVSFPATLLRVQREVQVAGAGGGPQGKRVVPQLVCYWFVGGDRIVASHWQRVLWDAWSRVTRGRADRWAYVLMQTDASDGEAQALARMQAVLDATLPVFQGPVAMR